MIRFFRHLKASYASALLALFLAACATPPAKPPADDSNQAENGEPLRERVANRALHFSQYRAGNVPKTWQPWVVRKDKPSTEYALVNDPTLDKTVLRATSNKAASGLMHSVNVDVAQYPRLRWHWKVPALIPAANVQERSTDDSPVRVIVTFDGDHSKIPLLERGKMELAELVTGQAIPYASIVYVWDNALPVGAVVAHPMSQRLKYIVAASGKNNLGQWRRFTRNLAADFELAFKEPAGKLLHIGVMTDSDNTARQASAYYGDMDLLAD